MTVHPSEQKPTNKPLPERGQGLPEKLEKVAQEIDPPSREIPNQDIKDPGRMTPDAPPAEDRS